MKSLLRIITCVLAVVLVVFLAQQLFIASAGLDMKNKRYEKAAEKYELILKANPNSVKYRSLLADCLLEVPFTYENQKRICDYLEKYKGEAYAYTLEQRLAEYKAELDLKIGVNYIYKALFNNKVMHWEDDAFPLRVYIPQSSISGQIKKAFDYWAYATANFISFTYVDNADDADIKISISSTAKTNCDGCAYTVAVTTPTVKSEVLKLMEIKFNEKDPYGRAYTADEIYKVALHEIGHAIGIIGHSDNPDNLMYASGNEESADFADYHSALTREDINTLNVLYMIAPDISSVPHAQRDTRNKIYPGVILGTSKEIKNRDIQAARAYISKAPNLAVGYVDLGNAYFQSDMYSDALRAYNKGLELSVDRDEKYLIAYNMSLAYLKVREPYKALDYANYAKSLNPTDEIIQLIHDIEYPLSIIEKE